MKRVLVFYSIVLLLILNSFSLLAKGNLNLNGEWRVEKDYPSTITSESDFAEIILANKIPNIISFNTETKKCVFRNSDSSIYKEADYIYNQKSGEIKLIAPNGEINLGQITEDINGKFIILELDKKKTKLVRFN